MGITLGRDRGHGLHHLPADLQSITLRFGRRRSKSLQTAFRYARLIITVIKEKWPKRQAQSLQPALHGPDLHGENLRRPLGVFGAEQTEPRRAGRCPQRPLDGSCGAVSGWPGASRALRMFDVEGGKAGSVLSVFLSFFFLPLDPELTHPASVISAPSSVLPGSPGSTSVLLPPRVHRQRSQTPDHVTLRHLTTSPAPAQSPVTPPHCLKGPFLKCRLYRDIIPMHFCALSTLAEPCSRQPRLTLRLPSPPGSSPGAVRVVSPGSPLLPGPGCRSPTPVSLPLFALHTSWDWNGARRGLSRLASFPSVTFSRVVQVAA